MNTAQNGKGDKPRKVDRKSYADNYDRIFRKRHSPEDEGDIMRIGEIHDGREYLGNGSWQAVNVRHE
jgi:hypothetical protein